jgi:hypothetical protein
MALDELFAGKVVTVYVEDPARGGTFENVRIEKLDGRDFLVGTLAPEDFYHDPRAGQQFWTALDAVQMFTLFPDLPTAQAKNNEQEREYAKFKAAKRRRWWQR